MRSRRGARRLAGCVGVALTLLAAPEARANGRFPFANQLVVKTGPDADLYVRTSFGVLVSRDKGAFFDWICEPIIGFSGTQDPGLGVFDDGSISVAAFEGLFGSNDGGCSFSQAAAFAGEYVIDVAVFRDAPLHGIAVTSTARGEGYVTAAPGFAGGHQGGLARLLHNPGTPREAPLPTATTALPMPAGDAVRMETPGGGGFGDPAQRAAAAIAADIMDGKVSRAAAERDYGAARVAAALADWEDRA